MRKGTAFIIFSMMMFSMFLALFIFNSNNAISGTVIGEGKITVDTNWNMSGSPYYIEGNVTVKFKVNLTIDPGVEVLFSGDCGLFVEGNLTALGNAANMINFSSNESSPWPGAWKGIQINSTGYAEIGYCNITYANYGIFMEQPSGNIIQNNNISNNFNYGLWLWRSSGNDIQNNEISDNGWNGVHIWDSTGNTIINNTIWDNSQRGIFLSGSQSIKNNISLNRIFSNSEGIRIISPSGKNNITKNNISSNTICGVNLTTSSNNRLYHNIFWNNAKQAYDDGSNNLWDDGYPRGGNHWSDYSGIDLNSGPMQTEPGSDGIGDTPYLTIGGGAGAKDNYPLMAPSIERTFVYLQSPKNHSVVVNGTILDFIVIGDDIALVNYSIDGGLSNKTLSSPWDINETETGNWADGIYTIDVFVYDSEGNITEFWYNITIDSVKPEIILNSPPNGSLITPGIEINLTILDDHLDIVNFTLDWGLINTTIFAPFNIDTSSWPDGNRSIQVYAMDSAGNLNSTIYNFTVDGSSPLIILLDPGNNSDIKPGTILYFDISDPHLNVSAINYSVNGSGPYTFSTPYEVNTTSWTDGNYIVEVNATDELGNCNKSYFNFVADSIKPSIILVSPFNNSIIRAGVALDFEVTDLNLSVVNYSKNLGSPVTLTSPFNISTSFWVDGPCRIDLNAEDGAGNINSSYYNFTIATPPKITLVFPMNNSIIPSDIIIDFSIQDLNLNYTIYSRNGGPNQTLDPPDHDIDISSWGDGVHNITIYAEDFAGNTNTSLYVFTIDDTKPSIVLNSPLNNSVIPPGVTIDFNVTDAHLWITEYSINGAPPEDFVPTYDFDTTLWGDLTYSIEIRAIDYAGNEIIQEYIFIIDSIPPSIALDSPSNNSMIKPGTILDFNVTDMNLNYTTYSINGALSQNLSSPHDIDTTGWEGDYIIEIYAEDLAGHNASKWYFFTVDGILPTIILNSPDNNSVKKAGVVLDFDVFDIHLIGVNYSLNGGLDIDLTPPYDIDTTTWGDYTYFIEIKALDAVGNENISEFVIIIDSTPPIIQLLSPPNATACEIGTPLNFSIIDGNLDFVNYSVNSGTNKTLPFPYNINTSTWVDGDYTITVYAVDLAGNFNTSWYNFTLNDTRKPMIVLNSPWNLSVIPAGTVIDFDIIDMNLRNVNYSLDNGVDIALVPPYDIPTSGWSEGLHTLTVNADDIYNNANSSMFVFTIDSTPPLILLISPLNNSVILPGEALDFDIVDANLGSVNYSMNDEHFPILQWPFNISTTGRTDGAYTIVIHANDLAGNGNSSWFRFIIDSTPPEILLSSPVNGSFIKSGTVIDITIIDSNIDEVEYRINEGPLDVLPPPYDINTSGMADGNCIIEIHAMDAAGNDVHRSFSFTLDSKPPEVVGVYVTEPYYPFNNTIIIIAFNETMNQDSVISALNITPGLNYTIEWSADGKTLFLRNIEGLRLNETYIIKLGEGAQDLAGNHLAPYPGYAFTATIETELKKDEKGPSALEYWWVIPILLALLVISIILFFILMKERKESEEPKGPVEELEDMYVKMRAKEDIEAMESLLSFEEQFGDRIDEAKIMLQKAKKAFEKGDYNAITVYERTIRDMILEGPLEEKPEEK